MELQGDAELIAQLNAARVRHRRLSHSEHRQREAEWRRVYADAFRPGLRHREGSKAAHAFLSETATEWLLIPFLSDVRGTPVSVIPGKLSAFACDGPLLDLEGLSDVEFFVSPPDFTWTFVRTHEDHVLGGPYFVRAEWVEQDGGRRRRVD